MMNLFLFLLFMGFLWWGVVKYACTLEENKKKKEKRMIEEVIEENHSLTYKELKEILNTMSDKDLDEEVFVEYKAYCKDGKDWYHEWTDAVSYELIHTKSDHEFYNNRKYLKLYLKSYSDKTNEG